MSLTSLTVDHVLRDFLPPPGPFISGIKAVRCSSAPRFPARNKAQLVTKETLRFFFCLAGCTCRDDLNPISRISNMLRINQLTGPSLEPCYQLELALRSAIGRLRGKVTPFSLWPIDGKLGRRRVGANGLQCKLQGNWTAVHLRNCP